MYAPREKLTITAMPDFQQTPKQAPDVSASLARAGLESIAVKDEATGPELRREGDRVWLSVVVGGRRERLCEVSIPRVLKLSRQAAEIAEALAAR